MTAFFDRFSLSGGNLPHVGDGFHHALIPPRWIRLDAANVHTTNPCTRGNVVIGIRRQYRLPSTTYPVGEDDVRRMGPRFRVFQNNVLDRRSRTARTLSHQTGGL